jgi:hypothetical protein
MIGAPYSGVPVRVDPAAGQSASLARRLSELALCGVDMSPQTVRARVVQRKSGIEKGICTGRAVDTTPDNVSTPQLESQVSNRGDTSRTTSDNRRRVLSVRDIPGVVTRRCGVPRVGGRRVSRLVAGVSGPVVRAPQARQQRDRVAARLDIGHTGALAGARLPVVRDSTHDPQELASTLKFASRLNPAGTTRRWLLRRRRLRRGKLVELRAVAPRESPQVRVRGAVPHTIPTDETAFPGTRRHGC